MANKDYYSILGVNKNATDKEISAAFRKLSLKWHPDRWSSKSESEKKEAEAKYKEINYAHQVLSDPEKRKNYDTFGDPDAKHSPGGGFDMGGFPDIFSQFGGMHGFGNSFFGNFGQNAPQPGNEIQRKVALTIEEIFNGCTKKLTFDRNTRCPNCHGQGGTGSQCPHCHGTGRTMKVQRTPVGIIQQETACPHCHGTGFLIKDKCASCNGTGFRKTPNTVEVTFPPGMPNNYGVPVHGAGSESKSVKGANGDFIAIATYAFDTNRYTINGLDVIEKIYIPYYDLLLGCDYEITLPSKVTKKISLNSCTEDGKLIKLFNEGIKYNGQIGDYYLEIHYELPKELTPEERKNIENIKVEKTTKKYN